MPMDIVDEIILCDDNSTDDTIAVAKSLNIHHIISHQVNLWRKSKSLYDKAIATNADIVIMLHLTTHVYTKIDTAMVSIISEGLFVVFGSRILGGGALKGGMPFI